MFPGPVAPGFTPALREHQKAGYLEHVISAAHTNTFNDLCFNVRPLAFIEGRYQNHPVEQHFSIFCKTAVEDIAHYVTQCPLRKGLHHKFWFVFGSRKKFYFCR